MCIRDRNYILTNLVEIKELGSDEEQDTLKKVRKFLASNPKSKKCQFIDICTQTDAYDDIVYFLVDIYPLLRKKNLSDEEKSLLVKFKEIKSQIKNN